MSIFKKKNKTSNLEESVEPIIESSANVSDTDRDIISVGNSKKFPIKNILIVVFMAVFACIAVFFIFYAKTSSKDLSVEYEADQASVEQYNKEDRDNFDMAKYQAEQEALEAKRLADEEARRLAEEEARRLAEEEARKNKGDSGRNYNYTSTDNSSNNDDKGNYNVSTANPLMYEGNILLGQNQIASPPPKPERQDYNNATNSDHRGLTSGSGGDFLRGESFGDGWASKIVNRDFLLSSGTSLSCVLRTKVITTYEGLVMCQLAKDIYSDNGKNLLVRAGAILEGTQTKVMVQGQGRVFINWGTIRDNDVLVRIDALGTDMLGASGVPAWVDNHFWKRFGNALLLTFIDDAFAIAQTHANKSLSADNVTVDSSFGNQGSRMAEMALENSINIPPTAYINQGEVINVIVPRNVDFSSIYKNVSIK